MPKPESALTPENRQETQTERRPSYGQAEIQDTGRAHETEFVRLDGDGSGAAVEFDSGMLKADEGAWSVLADLGIVEGSEVRFKVTIDGQSAEIVATVAEA